MTVFFVIAIIVLTISNVLLWIVCKGLQIMIQKLCKTNMELCEEFLKHS